MPITITCECGRKLKANPENAGMKGRCPDCLKVFVIPKPQLGADGEARMKVDCAAAAELRSAASSSSELKQAEAAFRQTVNQYGHYWASHYGLANTLFQRFRNTKDQPDYTLRSEALSELKKAVKLAAGKQREPLLELARYTSPVDIKEGTRLYQKALRAAEAEQDPLLPVAWQAAHHFKFAVTAAEAGLNALSIDAFIRAMQLDPKQFQVAPQLPSKPAVCYSLALKKVGQS